MLKWLANLFRFIEPPPPLATTIGRAAIVTTPIQAGEQGRVALAAPGEGRTTYPARAASPHVTYLLGSSVDVVRVENGVLIVS